MELSLMPGMFWTLVGSFMGLLILAHSPGRICRYRKYHVLLTTQQKDANITDQLQFRKFYETRNFVNGYLNSNL
jgi:hypothetical protein